MSKVSLKKSKKISKEYRKRVMVFSLRMLIIFPVFFTMTDAYSQEFNDDVISQEELVEHERNSRLGVYSDNCVAKRRGQVEYSVSDQGDDDQVSNDSNDYNSDEYVGANLVADNKPDLTPVLTGITDFFGASEINEIVSNVVNMASVVWDLVDEGTSTLSYKSNSARALPRGVQCWKDLSGWQKNTKIFAISPETDRGKKLFKFKFRISYRYGGGIDGVGKFLTGVKVMPVDLSLKQGIMFKKDLNIIVEIPSVSNQGSHETEPVASMDLDVSWKYKSRSLIKYGTESFVLAGNGDLFHESNELLP